MSHILAAKLSISIEKEDILRSALSMMEKSGYKVQTDGNTFKIDLRSKGFTHCYTHGDRGSEWSCITIEKTGKEYTCKGDPYSIEAGYNTALRDLELSYVKASALQALKAQGFLNPSVKTMEKSTHRSIGKTMIKAQQW